MRHMNLTKKLSLVFVTMSLCALPALSSEMIEIGAPKKDTLLVITPDVIQTAAMAALGNRDNDKLGETWVTVNAQVGTFIGLRFQVLPVGNDRFELVLEGFTGGAFTHVGWGNVYGGGARVQITLASDGDNDAFVVAPGLSVYVMPGTPTNRTQIDFRPYDTLVFVTPSADIAWVHQFSKHFGITLGARVGGGMVVNEARGMNGDPARGELHMELGLFTGFRF